MLKRIHINKHAAARIKKTGRKDFAVTVKTYKENIKCWEAESSDPWKLVCDPSGLSCGAILWVETTGTVRCLDEFGNVIRVVE